MPNNLNIISKGLQHALVIDDKDSAVNYKKSNADNGIHYKKVDSLKQLFDFFKNGEEPFLFDTTDFMTFITADNREIPICKGISENNIFLKISTPELKKSDNDILLALNNNHYISIDEKIQWQKGWQFLISKNPLEQKDKIDNIIKIAVKDFNGYEHCQEILNNFQPYGTNDDIPAIKYCNNLKITINNTLYRGYLPSIGQLQFISDYFDLISYVLDFIGYPILNNLTENYWWSSTEESYSTAWHLDNGFSNCYTAKDNDGANIIPLFKKIN